MPSSRKTIIIVALTLVCIVFACFSLLIHYSFRENLIELQKLNDEKLSRLIAQSLETYFQRIKYMTEYAANDPAFIPDATKQEDALRYTTVKRDEAERLIRSQRIDMILERSNPKNPPEDPTRDSVFNWQIYKGLPEVGADNRLLAEKRRILARHDLRVLPELHYLFELDSNGDLIFLEPFETQKNITSFNYSFRDYLQAVLKSRRTALSEGYISHDPQRTQIISVATPIFDERSEISKVVVASISNATIRDRVFQPLREQIALQDKTVFYLIDRHGHIVAASSGAGSYQPVPKAANDEKDPGNIRGFGILKEQIKWNPDEFEKGNEWERVTKSWDTGSIKPYYSAEYVNHNGVLVMGTFYRLPILTSENKWGILIETPMDAISGGATQMRFIFIIAGTVLFVTVLFLGLLLWQHYARLTAELALRMKQMEHLSTSVAHDIRSPLVTLQMLLPTMTAIPDQLQTMLSAAINRLHYIANDLSSGTLQRKEVAGQAQDVESELKTELLSSIIASVATQKRLEYRNRVGLIIDFQMTTEAYGIFCRVDRTDFERVISNIINNSAEAIDDTGNISITLSRRGNVVEIVVSDDGHGIPANLLPKLFKSGATFGKPEGKGLGLYLAQKTIKSLGGSIKITSQLGEGSKVFLTLPQVKPPEWFCARVVIDPGSEIIIIDDDASIHGVWNQRLDAFRGLGLTTFHFMSPQELLDFASQSDPARKRLYLVDYEFRGSPDNGLNLIDKLDIASRSILVTSHDEEQDVRRHATRLGVTVLPKSMAAYVPIVSRVSSDVNKGGTGEA